MLRYFKVEDRTLKRQISIGVLFVYIDIEVQCRLVHRNHVILRTKITKFWRNGNDSKQRIKITSTNDEMRESHIIKRQLYTVRVNNSSTIYKADTFTSNHLTQIDHGRWPVKPGYVHGKPHTFGEIIHINDIVTSIL